VSERAFDAPTPVPPAGVTWRVPTSEDVPDWAELLNASQRVDGGEPISAEELAAFLAGPGWNPAADVRLLVAADGTLVGDGGVWISGVGRHEVRVHLFGGVRPEFRGRGLGRQLMEWLLRRGGERYAALDADVPGFLEVACVVGAPAQRMFAHYGFEPRRYWSHMAHPLTELPTRAAAQADGLRVVPYQEDLADQVRRAHNEAFADHWGSVEWGAKEWKDAVIGNPTFRPELSFVVLDGTRRDPTVATYVLSYENAPPDGGGPPTGYIGQVGTRRSWRGRGLASAAVCATLGAMSRAGYGRAALTVDTGSPTGAQGLYERLGFVTEHRRVTFQRPVGPVGV
jgi:mycothiol synthase